MYYNLCMVKRTCLAERKLPDYTKKEEICNMVTHIVGGAMGIVVLVLGIIIAACHHTPFGIFSSIIFGITMVLLYTMSSVYHGLPYEKTAKKVMQIIDHCSVFLLIAGTYTPITLCFVRPAYPALGWCMFGVIWAVAILGIVLNSIDLKRYSKLSMICYLGMGWCIILTFGMMWRYFTPVSLALLVGGGVAYTVGAVLYSKTGKQRYAHSIFHVFVLAGSLLHALFILLFLL